MIRTEGIVANRMRYSETSFIVTWITQEKGILKTIAKGGARGRRDFMGKMDLFHECEITFRESRNSGLHDLAEVQLKDPCDHLRYSYLKMLCATYFYELIAELVEINAPIPDFYEVLKQGIRYLRDHEVTPLLIDRYERRIKKMMGMEDERSSVHALFEQMGGRCPKSYVLLMREMKKLERVAQ